MSQSSPSLSVSERARQVKSNSLVKSKFSWSDAEGEDVVVHFRGNMKYDRGAFRGSSISKRCLALSKKTKKFKIDFLAELEEEQKLPIFSDQLY